MRAKSRIVRYKGVRYQEIYSNIEQLRKENYTPRLFSIPSLNRIKLIDTVNGVHYIDDSCSFSINRTYFAIESISTKVVLITSIKFAKDLEALKPLKGKIKGIVCVGKKKFANLNVVDTLEEAVHKAKEFVDYGDSILFSPMRDDGSETYYNPRLGISLFGHIVLHTI